MHYTDVKQLVDQSIEFPVEHATLIDQVGEVELMAPTGDSVTIGELLEMVGERTYQCSDTLYITIVGTLGDAFIGRKYYDDRGGMHGGPLEGRPARTL